MDTFQETKPSFEGDATFIKPTSPAQRKRPRVEDITTPVNSETSESQLSPRSSKIFKPASTAASSAGSLNNRASLSCLDLTPEKMANVQPDALKNLWGVLVSLNPQYETLYLTKQAVDGASGVYLMGRHKECDVVFSHQQISNRHCLIFKEYKMLPGMEHPTECVYVEDLSSNGTYVNGKRIGRNTRRLLSPGDEIQLAIYDPRKDKEPFDDKFYIFKMPQRPNQDGDGKSFQNEYLVTKVLGSGTFAQVKMAIHKATGRKFAVKIVDKERFKAKPKVVVSLEQEISILMSINHPCIISIHSVFDEQRYLYLVLELAKDGELFDLIVKNSKLSEADVRHILYQLFQALKYLHDRGVAHRDLKPENVLLANKQKLHIKISDFGLAKIVGEDSFLQSLCGTPSYVAPEVLTPSKQRNYGKAVDLWSCGVMMYICLCGFPPFSEELAPPSMQNQIRQGRFDFPSPYWDDISEEARDLVTKLLTVDPSKRATVDEALDHPWMHMQLDSEADSKLPDPSDFLSDLSRDFHRQNTSTSMASPSSPSPSPTDSTSFTPHVNDLASHVNDPDIVVSHPPIGDSETSLASTSPLNGQKNIQGPDDPSFPRLAPLYSKDATIYPKSETADSMSNLSEYDIAEMKSRPRVL